MLSKPLQTGAGPQTTDEWPFYQNVESKFMVYVPPITCSEAKADSTSWSQCPFFNVAPDSTRLSVSLIRLGVQNENCLVFSDPFAQSHTSSFLIVKSVVLIFHWSLLSALPDLGKTPLPRDSWKEGKAKQTSCFRGRKDEESTSPSSSIFALENLLE